MVNIVRVSNPSAPGISDPYGDAQRQQDYADLVTAQSLRPRPAFGGSNAQAIQLGLTQLAQAVLGRSLQGSAGQAADQADASQRHTNQAMIDALVPALNRPAPLNAPTSLDSLAPSDPAVALGGTVEHAAPTINPQHDAISEALANADPRVAGGVLRTALLNKATAPPPAPFNLGPGDTRFQPSADGSPAAVIASNPKPVEPVALHLERKTRLLDNQMAQDYNFNPADGSETDVGKAYKQKAPPATQINLADPTQQSNIESDARAVAAGVQPLPPLTGRGSNAGYNAAVRKRAYELHPGLDAADYGKRQAAEKAFAASVDGRNLDSYNTIAQHVDYGEKAYAALKNGDIPALNAVANYFGIQSGQSAPATYAAIANFLANETARATIGGQSGEADRQNLSKMFSLAASPAQAAGQYAAAKTLIGGRIMSSRRRYQSATRVYDVDKKQWNEDPEAFDVKLTPAAKDFETLGSLPPASTTPTSGWGKAVVVK